MSRYKYYANEVISYMNISKSESKRIYKDIIELLEEKELDYNHVDPVEIMGPAKELAKELAPTSKKRGDYVSKARFMGLPLIHVCMRRNGLAKGIVAIGPLAIGVFSFGGLSLGLVSVGGFGLGLLALGGISFGYYALGGIAIAYQMALGSIAISNGMSLGAIALGRDIAIGAITRAKVMYYSQEIRPIPDVETFAYFLGDGKEAFIAKVAELYGNLGLIKDFLMKLVLKL